MEGLAPGEVLESASLVGAGVCLEFSQDAELITVVTVSPAGSALVAHTVDILGEGFRPGRRDLLAWEGDVAAAPTPVARSGVTLPRATPPEGGLRERERAELEPRLARRRLPPAPAPAGADRAPPPPVGTLLEVNTATSCSAPPDLRSARVVAVTQRAVVMADENAGTQSFSDVELEEFGAFFD